MTISSSALWYNWSVSSLQHVLCDYYYNNNSFYRVFTAKLYASGLPNEVSRNTKSSLDLYSLSFRDQKFTVLFPYPFGGNAVKEIPLSLLPLLLLSVCVARSFTDMYPTITDAFDSSNSSFENLGGFFTSYTPQGLQREGQMRRETQLK
ncbi:hypothetical protein SDJN03_18996, partial [Cucurbita argyrosperma subsp. sororia]